MKIYKLKHTQGLGSIYAAPNNERFVAEFLRKLPEVPAEFKISSFQLADPTQPSADFYRIDNSVLVFSKKVYMGPLGQSLTYAGNIHETTLNDTGEEVFLLNVTAVYNCLDKDRTGFRSSHGEEKGVDHRMGVITPAFFSGLIGDSSLFRVPQQLRSTIYVASRGHGSSDDFYFMYQQSGLKGLEFEEVWDSARDEPGA